MKGKEGGLEFGWIKENWNGNWLKFEEGVWW